MCDHVWGRVVQSIKELPADLFFRKRPRQFISACSLQCVPKTQADQSPGTDENALGMPDGRTASALLSHIFSCLYTHPGMRMQPSPE